MSVFGLCPLQEICPDGFLDGGYFRLQILSDTE